MTAVVFVGPTLPCDDVKAILDATILPPVKQGDVYRAARDKPAAIGIIDGFFDGVPSVWHKEILWAIEQGIPVFGSASMGALRAAELADFGMIGVGGIFEDYLNGTLQDDDEVAVLHSPAELGFQPLSTPMVSIRATVRHAKNSGVLSRENAVEILKYAKARHYRQRNWKDLGQALSSLPGIAKFVDWLPEGQIDAKANDAREMLVQMADCLSQATHTPRSAMRTERTLMWKQLCDRVDRDEVQNHSIIDELRLNPELYADLRTRAVLSIIAEEEAIAQDQKPDRDTLIRHMADHRSRAGLSHKAHLLEWLESNDLSPTSYEDILADAARIEAIVASRAGQLNGPLLAELKRTDLYSKLRDRAHAKATIEKDNRSGAEQLRMVLWYFETRLGRQIPDNLDAYAVSLGLPDRAALCDLIEAEFLYCQTEANSSLAQDQTTPARKREVK
ncbi:TfuA-like protein [Ruegeria arenilitoris]|uniref:TfuA-like protein n=1 Tax=Ruegeria arenilitoris TaxID=1173585 RepID=UPI0014799BC5|nr:TfuA-like protein [Ruegeria arenilitoris]